MNHTILDAHLIVQKVVLSVRAIRILMNITHDRREVAESPGFGQSVREMEGGHKGALAGGISLVGYRRFERQPSVEKKK